MADIGFSLDPVGTADMMFDFSGNQARADRQIAQQNVYNQISTQLDQKKYDFSRLQYLEGKRRDDNKLQRFVTDANKAGISISTALGANPSSPVQVSIPGHGTRVAGTAKTKQIPRSNMQVTPQAAATEQTANITNRTRAEADLAFYRMLNEKAKWEQSRNPIQDIPEALPNRYDLYLDNTIDAIRHYKQGGYVLPTGAQWELPQSMGAVEWARPYAKQDKRSQEKINNYLKYLESVNNTGDIAP